MAITAKVTIRGTEYNLTYNSATGKYEAEINATQDSSYPQVGHYFPVTVTAVDEAGNSSSVDDTHATLGESCKLYVKEKIKPTAQILSPTNGANIITNSPVISFKLLDNSNGQSSGFSGIDISRTVLTVNGTTVANASITTSAVTGGYECSYTPTSAIPDGNCTVTVTCEDFDGNVSDTVTVTFKVDTVAPTLNVTSPVDASFTNQQTILVEGTTSDVTSSPVTVTIKVGGVDQGAVTVGTGGAFSKSVMLTDGLNTIVITSTDSAGKSTTVTRNVTLKTTAPVIQSVTITPNPVDAGTTFTISVSIV